MRTLTIIIVAKNITKQLFALQLVPLLRDPFTILLYSLYIKVQKRNGIARRKWTKINVHFSKGSWEFVKRAL
jgi:hypothetical protein